jgi:hypothetical protein
MDRDGTVSEEVGYLNHQPVSAIAWSCGSDTETE